MPAAPTAPSAKVLKPFKTGGKPYKEGDTYEGPSGDIAVLARQGLVEPPEEEEAEPAPAPKPVKAVLAKTFIHDGRVFKAGDSYEGDAAEIESLTRQGFIEPEKAEKKAEKAEEKHTPAVAHHPVEPPVSKTRR